MTSNKKKKQLSDTPMVGVRLGELRPRVEAACKRLGVDISEFVRSAVEQDLKSYRGTLFPRATFWSAAVTLMKLARAIAQLGIISEDSYLELKGAITATNKQVRASFEKDEWLDAVARFGNFPDLSAAERLLSQEAWDVPPLEAPPVAGETELLEAKSRTTPKSPGYPPIPGPAVQDSATEGRKAQKEERIKRPHRR
jgi:hypothetical protein